MKSSHPAGPIQPELVQVGYHRDNQLADFYSKPFFPPKQQVHISHASFHTTSSS